MHWPDIVPILTADDISASVVGGPKPLALWFLSTFTDHDTCDDALYVFIRVHHHTLNHSAPSLSSRNNGRRALLFNLTTYLLGYTEGQSDFVRIQSLKLETKINASQKL
jgi:hypothetical protein